ncbi:hypothetical protein [Hydrogenophaga sp.]|uniref:hypothetical protein n=1 Tax=Hydrogenophaga sp. TaxID=1904254 RepID=UPI003D131E6E
MSTAEELARILKQKGDGDLNEVGDKWGDWVCIEAAAHLRALDASHQRLVEALEEQQAAQAMPIYGDYSGFVWPKVEMRNPGETAWGWICEKHGLGYQSGCICCTDDWKRHQDDRDRAARYARDDALNEASKKARAALESAQALSNQVKS